MIAVGTRLNWEEANKGEMGATGPRRGLGLQWDGANRDRESKIKGRPEALRNVHDVSDNVTLIPWLSPASCKARLNAH